MIDTDKQLATVLPQLRAADWIALDTEADSLHAYPEKLCLIQLSIPAADLLLDPLASLNLAPVLEVLGQHELILHGADYDLRLLRKSRGFVPSGLFDTMLASRLLGDREFGLTRLVAKYLDVQLEKGPQKANWARRPLTPRMEAYARNDTRYLKPLADILKSRLQEQGRLAWHQETCARLLADCAAFRPTDPDLLWRVTAVNGASPKQILPRSLSPRRSEGILQAITQGLAVEHPPDVLRSRPYRQTEGEKRRMLALEKRRDERAVQLGIDPTLIASRAMLVLLAKDWAAHEPELMRWQRELLVAGANS